MEITVFPFKLLAVSWRGSNDRTVSLQVELDRTLSLQDRLFHIPPTSWTRTILSAIELASDPILTEALPLALTDDVLSRVRTKISELIPSIDLNVHTLGHRSARDIRLIDSLLAGLRVGRLDAVDTEDWGKRTDRDERTKLAIQALDVLRAVARREPLPTDM